MTFYSRYEAYIPFMTEEDKQELADSMTEGRVPNYTPRQLEAWSIAAGAKRLDDKKFWSEVKKCKI